jgi:metallo-beta-lactamase class B
MYRFIFNIWMTCFSFLPGIAQQQQNVINVSDSLKVIPLSDHVFIHVTELISPQFGRVPCNGLIYVSGNEAVIMDTPPSEWLSIHLLGWMKKKFPGVKVKAIIVNHFHGDCLGGLKAFHDEGATSYAYLRTPDLLKNSNDPYPAPQATFDQTLTLYINGKKVISRFPGEAHTRDNIVTWIEEEKVLFGGCMVKTLNASKGFLGDANVQDWPATIERVKKEFPDLKYVIPGHGPHGGVELLDYTIKLFSAK